jgi:hypothetical protein
MHDDRQEPHWGILLVLAALLIAFNQLPAQTDSSVTMPPLSGEKVLSDLYGVTTVQYDSAYHVDKDDDYVDRCSVQHVHRQFAASEKTSAFPGDVGDTVYSRVHELIQFGSDTVIVVIETYLPGHTCHACPALLGVAFYSPQNGTGPLFFQNSITTSGAFGRVSEFPAKALRLGRARIGLAFTSGFMGQGYLEEWTNIFSLVDGRFVPVWGATTSENDSGNCGDGDGKTCWGYSASLRVLHSDTEEWDSIQISTVGSRDSAGIVVPAAAERKYVHTGDRYVPIDTLQPDLKDSSSSGKTEAIPLPKHESLNVEPPPSPNRGFWEYPIPIFVCIIVFLLATNLWALLKKKDPAFQDEPIKKLGESPDSLAHVSDGGTVASEQAADAEDQYLNWQEGAFVSKGIMKNWRVSKRVTLPTIHFYMETPTGQRMTHFPGRRLLQGWVDDPNSAPNKTVIPDVVGDDDAEEDLDCNVTQSGSATGGGDYHDPYQDWYEGATIDAGIVRNCVVCQRVHQPMLHFYLLTPRGSRMTYFPYKGNRRGWVDDC